jgi:hypothetical protein
MMNCRFRVQYAYLKHREEELLRVILYQYTIRNSSFLFTNKNTKSKRGLDYEIYEEIRTKKTREAQSKEVQPGGEFPNSRHAGDYRVFSRCCIEYFAGNIIRGVRFVYADRLYEKKTAY